MVDVVGAVAAVGIAAALVAAPLTGRDTVCLASLRHDAAAILQKQMPASQKLCGRPDLAACMRAQRSTSGKCVHKPDASRSALTCNQETLAVRLIERINMPSVCRTN